MSTTQDQIADCTARIAYLKSQAADVPKRAKAYAAQVAVWQAKLDALVAQ